MKISFIGAGRWAITLALGLWQKHYDILMLELIEERLQFINEKHIIPELPPNITISKEITICNEVERVLDNPDIIFFAVPAQVLRTVLINLATYHFNTKKPILVSAMKGLENNTYKRMSMVLKEFYPDLKIVVLAGPGIPYDMLLAKPTSLVVAAEDNESAQFIQEILASDQLRIYRQNDVAGVELGGALKNVLAIAGGICDGLNLGDNAKAAIITRGLSEMIRFGIAYNANPMTFTGLSGIGDLMVTAYSAHSRNRLFGEKIGQGFSVQEALQSFNGVVEGYTTTMAVQKMSNKMRLELPIIAEITEILYNNANLKQSIKRLMQRPLKKETFHDHD